MKPPRIDCYHLTDDAISQLATLAYTSLMPEPGPSAEPVAFTAFDCFDQSLQSTKRLLLASKTQLELFADGRVTLSQPHKGAVGFVADLADGPVKHALADVSPLRTLLPIGTGQVQYGTLSFIDAEGKTHCRAHIARFTSQQQRSVTLVNLQGIKGYSKSLAQLRLHIQALGGTVIQYSTLYPLLFPALADYDPKPELALASNETAFDAANKIIASCLPIVRANEFGIIADHDTEFLHDYRIQLRKVRSVLSLFKGVYADALTIRLKARFSALAAPTGRLRDLDVYLLDKQKYYDLLPTRLHTGLDALFGDFAKQRAVAHTQLAKHLRSAVYKKEIADLASLFTRPQGLEPGPSAALPAHDYACERIWQRYRKVCKVAAGLGPESPDADVHELRIHCKKLRYLMEFFAPVFSPTLLRDALKPLKALQDDLGLFNDYSVQQEHLNVFLQPPTHNPRPADLAIAQSVGALVTVLHHRQAQARQQALRNFARFNRPKTQQAYRELFQPKDAS